MTRTELEQMAIETVCISFVGEVRYFADYFKIDYIKGSYELKEGKGYFYLEDKDNKTLLKEFDYAEAIIAWRQGLPELAKTLDSLVAKYKLEDPNISVIETEAEVVNSNE